MFGLLVALRIAQYVLSRMNAKKMVLLSERERVRGRRGIEPLTYPTQRDHNTTILTARLFMCVVCLVGIVYKDAGRAKTLLQKNPLRESNPCCRIQSAKS
jgi:hypothetical protein